MHRLVDVVMWVALSLWLALSLAGGIAAMAEFPAARELPLSMQGYEPFIAAEPVLGRQLVAGHLVERVFAVAEAPRLACAALTALALLAQLALSRKPAFARLRLSALAIGAAALLAGAFFALPAFQEQDRAYRLAAGADGGSGIAQAVERKPEVDLAHERASRISTIEVAAVLSLVVLSALAQSGAPRRG